MEEGKAALVQEGHKVSSQVPWSSAEAASKQGEVLRSCRLRSSPACSCLSWWRPVSAEVRSFGCSSEDNCPEIYKQKFGSVFPCRPVAHFHS